MAIKNPAEARNRAKEIVELLSEQEGVQVNLLRTIEKQAKEYETSLKVLKQINLQKQIVNETQKEIYNRTRNIDVFENNIKNRILKTLEAEQKIEVLSSKKISNAAKMSVRTISDINNLLRMKGIWEQFLNLQQRKSKMSRDDIDIVKKVASIQGLTLKQIINQNASSREKTRQLIRHAEILKLEKIILEQNRQIVKEELELKRQQILESKAVVKSWFEGIPIIGKTRDLFDKMSHTLRSMGFQSNILVKMMKGPLLVASASVLYILNQMWGVFQQLDKAAFEFRKQWGFSREGSERFYEDIKLSSTELAHLGVTFGDISDATTKLGREMGSVANVSKHMRDNISIFSKQFGISSDVSAKFLKTMASISGETIAAQYGMMGFVKELSNAYKVPLNDVMSDIATASATSYAYISKEPLKLMQSAVEARRLGTSLGSIVNTSKSLLNFTESISNEMEYSVLSGRSINLQRLRLLAYNKDEVGLNKEILRLSKEARYNQLDPWQQEAFNKMLGKTGDEIAKILQSEQEEIHLKKQAIQLAKENKPELLDELNKRSALMKMRENEVRDLGKIAEINFRNRQNQEKLVAITDSINKKIMELNLAILPLVNISLSVVLGTVNLIGKSFGSTMLYIGMIANFAKGWINWLSVAVSKAGSILKIFSPILSIVSKSAVFLGKWLTPIGWIITGFEFINNLWKKWTEYPKGIVNGFKAVGDAIVTTLVGPFEFAWKAVKGWLGNSPSKLGLLIVEGISSIGSMLYNVITSPFKKAWSFISKLFGKNNIIQPSIGKQSMNQQVETIDIPMDRELTNNEIQSYRELSRNKTPATVGTPVSTPLTNNTENIIDSLEKTFGGILSEIRGLREDMSSGKIGISIDGQLMNTTLARIARQRGSYGAIIN